MNPLLFNICCAVFSGILSALAIPNEIFYFGSPFFGFAALIPLYIAANRTSSYKETALLFAIDALATHLLSSYWLANFKDFAIFTLGASALVTLCIEAMAGCLFFCLNRKNIFSPLVFASVRVVYEWAKSTGFIAYPWGVLSMSAFRDKVLIQSADIFGVYGITFLMAFTAGILAELILYLQNRKIQPEYKRQGTLFNLICNKNVILLLLALNFIYGRFRLCQKDDIQKTLNAVLVQQNMDPWASNDDSEAAKISIGLSQKGIEAFEEKGIKPDLVVWSEAVLRYSFPQAYLRYTVYPEDESLIHYIGRVKTPFIIGGSYTIDADKKKYANAALMFDKTGAFRGYYGKSHLVPFAEVIPGVEYPWVRKTMDRLVGFSNGWTAGGTYTLFDINARYSDKKGIPPVRIINLDSRNIDPYNYDGLAGSPAKVRVAVPICFEDAFPDICGPFHQAGAEVFVNITDDSWSLTKSAEYQHFVVAAFRAVEYRTTLVRSTNAGFTAVVDPKGKILQSIPLFEQGFLAAEIPVYARKNTVYAQYTNWFVYLILIIIALALFFKARAYKKPPLRECIQKAILEEDFYE